MTNQVNEQNPLIDVTLISDNPTFLASVDITFSTDLGDITIKNFKVLKGDRGLWIAFPRTMYLKDNEQKYFDIIEVSKRVKKNLSELILSKYNDFQKNSDSSV